MNKEANERFKLALGQDGKIATTLDKVGDHPGVTPEYLSDLGLEKKHLKRLESEGRAVSARTKNIWLAGEEMPNGKVVESGSHYRGKGSKKVWILIIK